MLIAWQLRLTGYCCITVSLAEEDLTLGNCYEGSWLLCDLTVMLMLLLLLCCRFQSPEPHPASRSGGRSPERCLWSGRELHPRRSTVCSTPTGDAHAPLAGGDTVQTREREMQRVQRGQSGWFRVFTIIWWASLSHVEAMGWKQFEWNLVEFVCRSFKVFLQPFLPPPCWLGAGKKKSYIS